MTPSRFLHNESLIADFRAHAGQVGSGPFAGRPLLLLTTTGARSRKPHVTPLVYTRDGDRWTVVASKGGAPSHPSLYHNLVANPEVTVEVGADTLRARAKVAAGAERQRLWDQHAGTHAAFKGYEQRTSRVIPVVVLEKV